LSQLYDSVESQREAETGSMEYVYPLKRAPGRNMNAIYPVDHDPIDGFNVQEKDFI
jgi:hypothetical protein